MFILKYVQPRPATYDPNAIICERKQHIITASSEAEAQTAADAFLQEGAVCIGNEIRSRTSISLASLALPRVIELERHCWPEEYI